MRTDMNPAEGSRAHLEGLNDDDLWNALCAGTPGGIDASTMSREEMIEYGIANWKGSKMKYYVITGRIPGDDEDTALDVGQHGNGMHAFEAFREQMWDTVRYSDDTRRNQIKARHGTDVFVNAIISSETPMEVVT